MNSIKIAVVTGASSGIGRETAKILAGQGTSLILTARDAKNLSGLKKELGNTPAQIFLVSGDLTKDTTRKKIGTILKREFHGQLHALLNIAGINHMGTVLETSPQKAENVFMVNYFAVLYLIRDMLPFLQNASPAIILNVSSIAGQTGIPGRSVYCASKAALEALSQSLRIEQKLSGIQVKVFRPGAVRTNFHDNTTSDAYTERSDISPRSPEQSAQELVALLHSNRNISSPGLKNFLYQKIARYFPLLTEWGLKQRFQKRQHVS